jgi:hypothetical protein
MPYNKKQATAHGAKKFGPKSGSRSPNHRGYRPEPVTDAPKKKRWNADERAERAGNPTRSNREGGTGGGSARAQRPNWEPRQGAGSGVARGGDRTQYGDRTKRSFDDRAPHGDRPKRSYDDRPARSYDDRPKRTFDDRPKRS